jgi:signal transduction histidine kinase
VSRTIDDLLELSRIELGEEPVRDVVDVFDASRAPSSVTAAAETRQTTIEVSSGRRGSTASVPRTRVALGNLVENAVKYSEPGTAVQVRVRVEGHGSS